MKIVLVLAASVTGAAAYSGSFTQSKNSLRSVGHRNVVSGSSRKVGASIKMEGKKFETTLFYFAPVI